MIAGDPNTNGLDKMKAENTSKASQLWLSKQLSPNRNFVKL